ncbi:MAG TPA: hypothetical protein VFZ09_01785 [Archangium sp.]|uniref:hypothetical protein n=1 Tax=Archangium sp. TaxID=1872627 RepID=UPI002E327985|nr:hypothetical protein [Archangium sp.]HEX5744941.1 hypothetical protein [Archangium sp.]
MTKKIVGLFATVALLSSGVALANDDKGKSQQQGQTSGQMGSGDIGGAGDQGQTGHMQGQTGHMGKSGQMGMMGEKQVTGTVVKSSSNQVSLRTDNGIIPLKIDKDTQFQDPSVKRVKDLKEGQQVRASFDIKGTDNVAKSISLDNANTGGSGLEGDTGINQDINKDKDMGGDVGGGAGDKGGSGDVKY